MRTVAGRLGHADPSVILRVYSHVIEERDWAAAAVMGQVLEAEVLRSIRWPEPEELDAISDAMDSAIDHVRRGDGHGALRAVRRVSFAIFELSPLHLLVAETKRFWDRAAVYRALDLASLEDPDARDLSGYYETLLGLLESQDRDGLVALNSEHRMSKAASLRGA